MKSHKISPRKTKMCTKTPLHSRVIKSVIKMNDQLQFYIFMNQEMKQRIDDFGPKVADQFTPDLFNKNPFSSKINVTLKQLRDFQIENEQFTLAVYFSTCYETASGYYELAHDLLSEINSATYMLSNSNNPESTLYKSLAASGYALPDFELIETLSYIRFRRNHFIHLSATPNTPFSNLIHGRGTALNSYWGSRTPPQNRLDFSSDQIQHFAREEVIQLLGHIMIIFEELDGHIASLLDRNGVLTYLAKQRFGNKSAKINKDIAQQRAKTIRTLAVLEFGLHSTQEEIVPIIYAI